MSPIGSPRRCPTCAGPLAGPEFCLPLVRPRESLAADSCLALGGYGFRVSLGGRPAFGDLP